MPQPNQSYPLASAQAAGTHPTLVADVPDSNQLAADLANALEWVAGNLEAALAGKPVRDADECLSHTQLLLKKAQTAGIQPM